jgi:hypothetical protein
MSMPESQPKSVHRPSEVARLTALSLELKRQVDEIERRIGELKLDIAARPSDIQRPESSR